ncbi:MAG TPA: glycosyltransferase family 2 protein [bacterium]|nr:glycosyltransferase family 2 protein [bacterium]HPP88033.1 glycosyltransferase family 2 protein [bacterium]
MQVNDGSKDNTSEIAKNLNVNVIDLPNNLGIGGAMQTGFKFALRNGYDIAVQIDGDGQHNPDYLNDILKPVIENKCDMVIGSRFIEFGKTGFQSSCFRRLGIKILSFAIKLTINFKITDPTSGFRAFNKKVIAFFAEDYPNDYPEPESIVMLIKNNFKIIEAPVIMSERYGGKSSISSIDSIYYMIKVLLAIFIDCFKYR